MTKTSLVRRNVEIPKQLPNTRPTPTTINDFSNKISLSALSISKPKNRTSFRKFISRFTKIAKTNWKEKPTQQ